MGQITTIASHMPLGRCGQDEENLPFASFSFILESHDKSISCIPAQLHLASSLRGDLLLLYGAKNVRIACCRSKKTTRQSILCSLSFLSLACK